MGKKYLSLEEAAEVLKISVEELKSLREKGEIRGFADRATWKFRTEDVEEFARARGTSDPDPSILDSSPKVASESDVLAEQETVIRSVSSEASAIDEDFDFSHSDSSVRLVVDDDLAIAATGDTGFISKDSDSDVRLVEEESGAESDSDVRLVGESDSDVRLLDDSGKSLDSSDSDVRLVSDSSKDLDKSDSAISIMPDESGALGATSPLEQTDSDVKVVSALDETDATILNPGDSGISLEADDSGISLEMEDSGIALVGEDDSGIALVGDDDSGISLLDDSEIGVPGTGNSGIALEDAIDSGLSLEGSDVERTAPLSLSAADDQLDETQLEVPSLAEVDDESDFELSGTDFDIPAAGGTDTDTGVIVFDDDGADDFAAAGTGAEALDDGYDEFVAPDFDEFEDGLDVAPDIMGEDDGLDVFEAGDDEFTDQFQTSGSQAEFAAPASVQTVAAEPAEWGVGSFLGIFFGTALMAVCAIVMFDLVRSLWGFQEPLAINSFFLKTFGGMFK